MMSILPQLERDLLRTADRRLSGAPEARGWWRRRGVALPVALAALALVGAGSGELLLAPGKPVPPAFVLPANPTVGLGRPVAASLALLPMRVGDPAGGPPWGMRVIQTTRGLVCLQAGRVLDGHLGGLGIGYALRGDGRFHPFSPADAISVDACATVDRNGRASQPGAPAVVSVDGLPLAGENLYPYERVHCDLPGEEDWGVRCPQADLREVAVGLLGPDATSITASAPKRRFAVRPYGPDGAYLIVLPAPPHANIGPYGFPGRKAPGTPTLTVTFRNGSTCRLPANNAEEQCTPEGIVRLAAPRPTAARMRTPLHVRYLPRLASASPPLMVLGRSGATAPPKPGSRSNAPGPGLVVSFRAPTAAPNISSGYDLILQSRPVPGCSVPATIVAQPTQQTIAAGQRVRITVPLEGSCRATYLGRVFFVSSSGSYSEARQSDRTNEGPLYEVIAAGLFRGKGASTFGATVGRFQISVP